MPLKVAIFDDVLVARGEEFRIPGLEVTLYPDADDVLEVASVWGPAVVCMDFAMGPGHASGEDAIRALRGWGYRGRVVAMSSDPAANARMLGAGADESIREKAMLRSFLVALGREAQRDEAAAGMASGGGTREPGEDQGG